ncbi:MAG TPA: hypothetical protein VK607_16615 [Kofleriaceae bacterium]|nr:hypothetical protein [Kofleriaceae bacterium]
MTRSRAPWWLACGAALAALYAAVFAIVGSAMFARAPGPLALAVTFDLTVSATLLVWWLGVRRGAIPWWFAVATLSWGVAAARAYVPHAPIAALAAAGVALEILTVGWLLVRIRRVVRGARAARDDGPIGALEAGLVAARFPARVAAIVATELAVGWLALTGWFRRPRPGFAMRSSGWLLFAGVLCFLIAAETVVLHIALAMWKPLIAWISTVSSLYAVIWLIGDAQAIRLYPVAIIGGALRVTVGVRGRAAIPLADIASVIESRSVPDGALSLALMEPTVLVTLRVPVEVIGLLGRRRRVDRLALTIDDPKALIAAIAEARDGA